MFELHFIQQKGNQGGKPMVSTLPLRRPRFETNGLKLCEENYLLRCVPLVGRGREKDGLLLGVGWGILTNGIQIHPETIKHHNKFSQKHSDFIPKKHIVQKVWVPQVFGRPCFLVLLKRIENLHSYNNSYTVIPFVSPTKPLLAISVHLNP